MSNAFHPPRGTGINRRRFLNSGQTFLSAGVVAMLAGCAGNTAMPMSSGSAEGDVAILNVALGLEHEAIAAYQIGAESKLLDKPVLDVAVLFQGHHKEHRDALAATPFPAAEIVAVSASAGTGLAGSGQPRRGTARRCLK